MIISAKLKDLAENKSLPLYTSIGGYPLFYVVEEYSSSYVICPDCGNESLQDTEDTESVIVAYDINYEDAHLICEHCQQYIDPAYLGEKELEEARFGKAD